MNFQWILLAFLAVSLITELAKAITRPMLKNVLRLICVPVAFIITYILQLCGVFQFLVNKLIGLAFTQLLPLLGSSFSVPADTIEGMQGFLSAISSSILVPTFFVIAFSFILFFLRTLHVNLVLKYINSKKIRQEKKELRANIEDEKELVKDIIAEGEENVQNAIEDALKGNDNESLRDVLENASLVPDEDELEDMAEDRIKKEKKRKRKSGYFKESAERKAASFVCGAVSAFLIFAITMMPAFYGMEILSYMTDGIENTDADDTKVYHVVNVIDKHIVEPYESSFVIQLYDSIALLDLLNDTARLSAKITLDDGKVVYVDDIMRNFMTHGVSAAAEMTSGKSEQKNLANDIDSMISDPVVVDLLADMFQVAIQKLNAPNATEGDLVNQLVANIINHYKTADKAVIKGDIHAANDTIILVVQKGILRDIISGNTDMEGLLADRESLSEIIVSMTGVSIYRGMMESAFTLGIDMLGTSLEFPAETVAEMKSSTNFAAWDDPENGAAYKEADSEKFLSIIFGLLDIMESFGASTEGSGNEINALLDQFVNLGVIMDIMTETQCLHDLPPVLLEGLVSNEMLSAIVTPEMVEDINETVKNDPDLSYEQYLKSLAALFKMILGTMA